MYNEEFKMNFLANNISQSVQRQYVTLFNHTQKFEYQLNKDFYQFSKEEAVHCINQIRMIDLTVTRNVLPFVNNYRSLSNNSSLDPIKKEDLDFANAIRKTLYKDIDDLFAEIEKAVSFEDGYYSVAATCFAWLGIDIEDVGDIPDTGVDFDSQTIYVPKKGFVKHTNNEKVFHALKTYAYTNEAIRTQNRTFTVKPLPNGKFLHLMVTKNSKKPAKIISKKDIMSELSFLKLRIEEAIPESRLTYANVLKSGRLNRIYQAEQNGLDIASEEGKELLIREFNNKGDIFDLLHLYRKYKEAFELQ